MIGFTLNGGQIREGAEWFARLPESLRTTLTGCGGWLDIDDDHSTVDGEYTVGQLRAIMESMECLESYKPRPIAMLATIATCTGCGRTLHDDAWSGDVHRWFCLACARQPAATS